MQLPRPYISWNQMQLWFKSRTHTEYINYYTKGKEVFQSEALRLGKLFAQEKEFGMSADPVRNMIIGMLPKRQRYDKEMRVIFEGHELLLKPDADDDTSGFDEYKTGTALWDDVRVVEHRQLNFYAFGRHLRGLPNDNCNLFWMPADRENESKKLNLTGEIIPFKLEFSQESHENIAQMIRTYVEEVTHYQVLDLR
jgi:hypothetical protein